jgi:hypothetical protein
MIILYTLGAIFGFTIALIAVIIIITRKDIDKPEERYNLTQESEDLKQYNYEQKSEKEEK